MNLHRCNQSQPRDSLLTTLILRPAHWSFVAFLLVGNNAIGAGATAPAPGDGSAAAAAISHISIVASTIPDNQDVFKSLRGATGGDVRTLARLGTNALPQIRTALHDSSFNNKAKVVLCDALGRINSDAADSILAEVLDRGPRDPMVAAFAVRALARHRSPSAIAAIEQAVTSPRLSEHLRSRLMMQIGVDGFDDVAWLSSLATGNFIKTNPAPSTPISQLQFAIMLNAQRALGHSKNPASSAALIQLLRQHPDNAVLVDALGNKRDRQAIPVLLIVLQTTAKGSVARQHAARVLGTLRAREAVPLLIRLMESDSDPSMVSAAAVALGQIGDRSALPDLQRLVDNLKEDPRFGKTDWAQVPEGFGYIPQIFAALKQLKR